MRSAWSYADSGRLSHARYCTRGISPGRWKMKSTVGALDWSTIPAPIDDGATRHLAGARLPSIALQATNGEMVGLSTISGRTVIYAYPRTGRPGVENPAGWDMIPGARGCTPQSCSFRDHFAELKALGVDQLFGLRTLTTSAKQRNACICRLPSCRTSIWS